MTLIHLLNVEVICFDSSGYDLADEICVFISA
jgi:hypothetical protein